MAFSASAEIVGQFGFEEQQGAIAANAVDPSGFSDALLTPERGWTDNSPEGGAINLLQTSGVDLGTDPLGIEETQQLSVAFRINVSHLPPEFMNIIRKGRYAYPFLLQMDDDGRLYYGIRTNGVQYIIPQQCLQTGQWYHLALTLGNNEMVFYLNGEVVGRRTISGSITSNTWYNTYIGSLPGGTDMPGFPGSIDELIIANHAFNETKVRTLYTEKLPSKTLIFDHSFNPSLDGEFYRSRASQKTVSPPFYTWSIREESNYVANEWIYTGEIGAPMQPDDYEFWVTSKADWVVAQKEPAGGLLWENGYSSFYGTIDDFRHNYYNSQVPSSKDTPNSIAADNEGNVYVTGKSDYMVVKRPFQYPGPDGPGSLDDMWLIKLDEYGNILWESSYNKIYQEFRMYTFWYSSEQGMSVDVDAEGNAYVLISGWHNTSYEYWENPRFNYSLIKKYSKDGQVSTDWLYFNNFSADSLKIIEDKKSLTRGAN